VELQERCHEGLHCQWEWACRLQLASGKKPFQTSPPGTAVVGQAQVPLQNRQRIPCVTILTYQNTGRGMFRHPAIIAAVNNFFLGPGGIGFGTNTDGVRMFDSIPKAAVAWTCVMVTTALINMD
jgi:hypothetical protein